VRDGRPAEMYDYAAFPPYQKSLIGWDWYGVEGYRNPPFYALLYLPTTGLSYYASFLVWTAIGVALLVLAVLLLKPERPWRALGWALAFYPVFAVVSFGQNTFLSLAVFAGVYRLMESDRKFAAGLLAGLLWFKPQLLLGVFIWWALAPRQCARCWLGVGVTGLALAALSWLALPEASEAFVRSLRGNVGYGGERMWNKHTPKAFFELLLPGVPPAVHWGLAAAMSALSAAFAWRVARRTGAPVAVMFPIAVFLSLWASPHALVYEWALLVAAGVVLWERFPQRRDAWLCLFALAWVALTVSTPLAQFQINRLPVAVQVSVPLLGVVGWLAARELTAARSSDEQA
jgi:alpha-1,2-mannosyltransferase